MQGRLEPIRILDWYDGIVIGLVRLSWREGVFLASVLSWSQKKRVRALALIPVCEHQVEDINAISHGDWEHLLDYLRTICKNTVGDVSVVHLDEALDEIVAEIPVNLADLNEDIIADIEQALDPKRQRWLSLGR